jgi:hypothetical protein
MCYASWLLTAHGLHRRAVQNVRNLAPSPRTIKLSQRQLLKTSVRSIPHLLLCQLHLMMCSVVPGHIPFVCCPTTPAPHTIAPLTHREPQEHAHVGCLTHLLACCICICSLTPCSAGHATPPHEPFTYPYYSPFESFRNKRVKAASLISLPAASAASF